MRKPFALVAILGLTACGSGDQSRAGGVTAGEAKALDDAAEMIEQQRLPADALRSPAPAAQETQPEAE